MSLRPTRSDDLFTVALIAAVLLALGWAIR